MPVILWPSAFIGFLTSLSLAIAIGPQNTFILRQGLKREHVFKIALFCTLADFFLMTCGVYGLATIVNYAPYLVPIMKWGGCIFLFLYGLLSFRRAARPGTISISKEDQTSDSVKVIFLQLFAFTFLNPHVYTDTILLLGSIAQSQTPDGKLSFLLGIASGSFLWFFSLGYGSRILTPLFKKETSWRILDILIGLNMCALAITLLVKY